ncbi:MAG: beta,2-mannobiose phosphorylase / 1,2-beta-oligomannan phosphorylase [Gemmatimonadaceae bacterium]|nr:beta,2-mannobiose phosphorylase / 1,2-beta-oligomannan phosphorylase [Gemmatimonadaceae bacterium]
MIPPLQRFATNPIVKPSQIKFLAASGTFNPGVAVDRASGRVVLLVRVFEEKTKRSCLAIALSSDGERIDQILDRPAITRDTSYEEWGVEDARITYLEQDQIYAITYTGYSPAGPRVCLITTDDLLKPERYQRHGPRISGENKNCVIFPQKVGGAYVILHRPMPRIELIRVSALEDLWPAEGVPLVGPRPNTWRSSRVGSGAPPIATEIGWLFPFHGATTIEEGNVYSMGWCVLDFENPEKVLYVSVAPALAPEAPYEIQAQPIPQVDMANFITGVRVVFPEGLVELGDDLLVYYGSADVYISGARVNKSALIAGIKKEIALGHTALPL